MQKINDLIISFLSKHPTFPPHHNYTGPFRKSKDFSAPAVTFLDALARIHDQNVKSNTIVGTFKNTKDQSKGNILADLKFIGSYLLWYVTLMIYPFYKTFTLHEGNLKQKLIYISWNLPLDLFVGAIGCVIFTINIILNIINYFREGKTKIRK